MTIQMKSVERCFSCGAMFLIFYKKDLFLIVTIISTLLFKYQCAFKRLLEPLL